MGSNLSDDFVIHSSDLEVLSNRWDQVMKVKSTVQVTHQPRFVNQAHFAWFSDKTLLFLRKKFEMLDSSDYLSTQTSQQF